MVKTELDSDQSNRPFARSGHMVRNKLCWNASYTVGLSKQRNVGSITMTNCEFSRERL